MNILILGGNNPDNKAWVHALGQVFSKHFNHVLIHEYLHWFDNRESIDLDKEAVRLQTTVGDCHIDVVFAKSAGTIIALKAMLANVITPRVCAFVGTPMAWAEARGIDLVTLYTGIQVPVLFIQHTADPTISANDLKKIIDSQQRLQATFLQLPGDSHAYPELDALVNATVEFIQQN
jgi:hypothetical protein